MPFPFRVLRTIVGRTSAIDLERLHVEDLDSAADFIDSYGFDWFSDEDREDIERIRGRAVAFIEEVLLDPSESILPSIRNERDVRELLVLVSTERRTPETLWACAILRVMHTVAHATSDMSATYGVQIREQILRRFRGHVHAHDGQKFLGDIPIVHFDERSHKTANSIVMKLLHKPENVAASVFDRIALRFVTTDRLGALFVVRYLRSHNVLQFANIQPSRSRNTLVDVDRLEELISGGSHSREFLAAEIERWPYPEEEDEHRNQFSSHRYRSIQFTCRQRVRIPTGNRERLGFFFPFEVQILDQASYGASRVGVASHAAYKERQRQTCRRRVLGQLFEPTLSSETRSLKRLPPELRPPGDF